MTAEPNGAEEEITTEAKEKAEKAKEEANKLFQGILELRLIYHMFFVCEENDV